MATRVQMLRWGAPLGKNTMGGSSTSGQVWHGGDQQPPLPPPLRAGTEGPKSQLCLSDVHVPPKPRPLG